MTPYDCYFSRLRDFTFPPKDAYLVLLWRLLRKNFDVLD